MKLQYGSSVISTENRACMEIARAIRDKAIKGNLDERDYVYVFWCNDWIIIEGQTSCEVPTSIVWKVVFDYLQLELGYTEDQCRKITIHNKLTFLGKVNKEEE